MWQDILQSVRSYDVPQRNVIVASCALGGGGLLVFWLLTRQRKRTIEMGEGWWGFGEKSSNNEDESIRPFEVKTSEKEIQDLYQRLDLARYTPPLEGAAFHYGFNSNYLQKVVSYWRNQFDWNKQVDILNQYPHFKTTIEGIEIHFIHVKPTHIPSGQTPRPLLMVHGWPGSFYEFYKIIPLLTNPVGSGSSGENLVFEVICPSIPGYGFSEAPHKQGFDMTAAARIFHKLMHRLGFQEYYLQGGDWGSGITTHMAQMLPKSVKGLHLNMVFLSKFSCSDLISLLLGAYVPWLVGLTREDSRRLFPYFKTQVSFTLRESGYMHIQATKPDTAGCGLNNCPVGLAAYILEKFSTWTDKSFPNLDDGGLERKYSLDDLLTNVMIYWVTGSIVTSMRFYKENLSKNPSTTPSGRTAVYVPTGVTAFPDELLHAPPSWVKRKFKNLVTYSYMPRGGHFPAFEEPQLLAQDFKQFIRKVEHL
ncbi:epoxide hydrolase 1 isoform X1 [Anolis carolinensis]|uniref:Epoxide hydrolase n=2 Tax=Anolis carolinensis TaxID=28377 RepID=G1KWQ1_ANOCA|nr:PREDICTED: epoxide hydrolase 1 [Anolis carolinensis]|eukprot:XP_003215967.1 PREDICTED: epoxide hydrolase 1 [Anolis carolinensis]